MAVAVRFQVGFGVTLAVIALDRVIMRSICRNTKKCAELLDK
jgi:hypothetical protein